MWYESNLQVFFGVPKGGGLVCIVFIGAMVHGKSLFLPNLVSSPTSSFPCVHNFFEG